MNNLDRQYQQLLQDIIDNGVQKGDRTGTGTISVFGRQIRHKMSDGFPLLTTKKMAWKTMVTELLWFLRGDTNIKYLVDNGCNIWNGDAFKRYDNTYKGNFPMDMEEFVSAIKADKEFANRWGDLGPIYGAQWRKWKGIDEAAFFNSDALDEQYEDARHGLYYKEFEIDQIEALIFNLQTNPDSRRLMVSAWNIGQLDEMVLPPCHYGFQVYTRELSREERFAILDNISIYNKRTVGIGNIDPLELNRIPTRAISLIWNQRSVDTFLGLPFNIASYGLLLEIIAKAVNMVPDELIGNLGDTHLYSNHIEQAKEQISRTVYPLPKLNINTEFWPTESGECGVGPVDAAKVFESFKDDNFCKCLLEEDIQLQYYVSHPAIKAPLSN